MKKRIGSFLLIASTFIGILGRKEVIVNAQGVNMVKDAYIVEETLLPKTIFGNIEVNDYWRTDGVELPLLKTFNNQTLALDQIANNKVVELIGNSNKLGQINEFNWNLYYDYMFQLLETGECSENDYDFRQLRAFFDIYENHDKNQKALKLVEKIDKNNVGIYEKQLYEVLPQYLYSYIKNNWEISSVETYGNLGFDIDKGIQYAEKYAESPNSGDYKVFSKDCTNFASQILEAGGIKQEVYSSENKGWWHKKSKTLFITSHSQSVSWVRADTFARYMGVGYTTENHLSFTKNIKKGDFIAADFTSDGDWDHIGFVTKVDDYLTKGYYDYKVAQHTTNYYKWASSDKNNWDLIGEDGGTYGRVRR